MRWRTGTEPRRRRRARRAARARAHLDGPPRRAGASTDRRAAGPGGVPVLRDPKGGVDPRAPAGGLRAHALVFTVVGLHRVPDDGRRGRVELPRQHDIPARGHRGRRPRSSALPARDRDG